MSTPKTVTDGSSDLDEAVLNLFLRAGKVQVKMNYCRIDFTSATEIPTVSAAVDSDGEIVTGDLSYDAVNEEIDVVLTGFTAAPAVFVTIIGNGSTNVGDILPISSAAALISLRFIGTSGGQASVDPDGNVFFTLLVIGV